MSDNDPAFDWQQVDHTLAALMLTEVSEEFRKNINEDERRIRFENRGNENVLAIPAQRLKMHILRTDEWAKRVYDVYCGAWQRQGNALSPEFLRAACANGIGTLVAARTGAVIAELELQAAQTNLYPIEWLRAVTAEFRREMERLFARWQRRVEIEAKTLEHRQTAVVSTASKASTWQGLHIQFDRLGQEELTFVRGKLKDHFLRAYADYRTAENPEYGDWTLSEGPNEGFRARFEILATRAGVALGSTQRKQALDCWLHHVFMNLLDRKSKLLVAAAKGEGGIILRACEASAIYCSRLEKRALESGTDDGRENESAAIERASPSPRKLHPKQLGRVPRLTRGFVDFAGGLWREATHPETKVSGTELGQIASKLDEKGYIPPADYLEGRFAQELKAFNSRNSNSKIGAIRTWSRLVSLGDKDHLRGMRRLLSRCASKQALP